MLIKLAEAALTAADWLTEVLTGRLTFELGDTTRNTAKTGGASSYHSCTEIFSHEVYT